MAYSKGKKQLSRREREEAAMTRRTLLIGGGVVAIGATASLGYTMLPPVFPTLNGKMTIDARVTFSEYDDYLLRLTKQSERTDVLVIGTTDCSYCQAFVEGGLDDLIAYGEDNGLGIAYAPVGMSATSLGSTRALKCFAKASASAPADVLRKAYSLAADLGTGDTFEDAMRKNGDGLGLTDAQVDACVAEDPLETTRRMQAFTDAFELAGTPMFHVANPDKSSETMWFSGYTDAQAVIRQIKLIRGKDGA